MKQKIVYEALDGARFDDPEQCEAWDRELAEVAAVMRGLPERKIGHHQWFQHNAISAERVRSDIWDMVCEKYKKHYPDWKKTPAHELGMFSIVGRVLCDSGCPLNRAWYRLSCIDWDTHREYNQPYMAMHPDKATEEVKP